MPYVLCAMQESVLRPLRFCMCHGLYVCAIGLSERLCFWMHLSSRTLLIISGVRRRNSWQS